MNNEGMKIIAFSCLGLILLVLLAFIGLIILGIIVSADGEIIGSDEVEVMGTEPSPSHRHAPEEVEEADVDTEEDDGQDLTELSEQALHYIIQSNWNELTEEEQHQHCVGWAISPEDMVDAFMEGYNQDPGDYISDEEVRNVVEDFYDEQCE